MKVRLRGCGDRGGYTDEGRAVWLEWRVGVGVAQHEADSWLRTGIGRFLGRAKVFVVVGVSLYRVRFGRDSLKTQT